jgi:outer membrane biosynthesis protein TonB
MASTRAKARALRDLTNIGMTCLEELAGLDDVLVDEPPKTKPKKRKPAAKKTRAKAKKAKEKPEATPKVVPKETPEEDQKGKSNGETKTDPQQPESSQPEEATVPKMSEAQRRAVYNLSRRRGISVEELDELATETFGSTVEYLSSQDASTFIRQLQQSA